MKGEVNPYPDKYGYDLSKVPDVLCLYCDKAIGHNAYVEIRTCARFGQMLFAHKECDEGSK